MSKSKLEKVLEYLINEDEDKAKTLLHDIFIEKARAIHESLLEMDDEHEDEVLGGDEEHDFKDEVGYKPHKTSKFQGLKDEIETEETDMGRSVAEDEDEDEVLHIDDEDEDHADDDHMDDDFDDHIDDEDEAHMDDDDHIDDAEIGDVTEKMGDLEDALAELKAAFAKLDDEDADLDSDDDDLDPVDPDLDSDDDDFGGMDDKDEYHSDDEEVDESWLEEFADLAENINLDVVTSDIYADGKTSKEVGSGRFVKPDGEKHSPVAKSQTERMGAKPVKTGQGKKAEGYTRETAPTSKAMNSGDNRKKKSTDGREVIGDSYGKTKDFSKSKLEHDSDFKTGKEESPFTRAPSK